MTRFASSAAGRAGSPARLAVAALLAWQGGAGAAPAALESAGEARPGVVLERWVVAGATLALRFDAVPGQALSVEVGSTDIDPILHQLDPQGELVAADDNGGAGLAARLRVAADPQGAIRLKIFASHPGAAGRVRIAWSAPGAPGGDARAAYGTLIVAAVASGNDRLLLDAYRGLVTDLAHAVGPDSAAVLLAAAPPELEPLAAHPARDVLADLGTALLELAAERYPAALSAGQRARDAARALGAPVFTGFAHLLLGSTHLARNDPDIGILELQRALPLLDASGQPELAARARYEAGRALGARDRERAIGLLAEAAATWTGRGDLPRAALAEVDRGRLLRLAGRRDGAREAFATATRLLERGGDPAALGAALDALGVSHRLAGDYQAAAAAHARALELSVGAGRSSTTVADLLSLARLARARGAYGVAIDDAELAHRLSQKLGLPRRYVESNLVLGGAALRLDDLAAAERFLGEARRLSRYYGFSDLGGRAQGALAKLALARHQPGNAPGVLANAQRFYRESGNVVAAADVEIDLARVTAELGQLTRAESGLRQTEARVRELPGQQGLVRLRAERGRILRAQGRLDASRAELEAAIAALDGGAPGRLAERDGVWRLDLEHARTLHALGREEKAAVAYRQAIEHLIAAPLPGELGFDDGALHQERTLFDEAIGFMADRGALDAALELALLGSEVDYRFRWSGEAAGETRTGDGHPLPPLAVPELDAVRAALEQRGVTLLAYRVTPRRLLSWVLPAPGGLGAAVRDATVDSLLLWNGRMRDSLTAGFVPRRDLELLRARLWAPVERWLDPARPLLVLADPAIGHLPLELLEATPADTAGGDPAAVVGARYQMVYATRPAGLLGGAAAGGGPGGDGPHAGPQAGPRTGPPTGAVAPPDSVVLAWRPELAFPPARRDWLGQRLAAAGLGLAAGAAAGEAELRARLAAGGRVLDLAYPCDVTRGVMVRTALAVADEYRPPHWRDADIHVDPQIPVQTIDGRLTADEVRAAGPAPLELVVLRTLCIEADAMPSATLVEGFQQAGARVVLLPRWGSLGNPARTDRLLAEIVTGALAPAARGGSARSARSDLARVAAALQRARRDALAAGGVAARAGAWAAFVVP